MFQHIAKFYKGPNLYNNNYNYNNNKTLIDKAAID